MLAQTHKKQTAQILERKSAQPANAKAPGREKPMGVDAPLSSNQYQDKPTKILFVVISLGLVCSVVTGVAMAWKFGRDRRLNLGLVIAGAVIPILLLVFCL